MDAFDKHISNTLNSHSSAVSAGLWDNIDAAINDKDDRVIIPFWRRSVFGFGAVALLSVVSIFAYNYLSPAEGDPSISTEVLVEKDNTKDKIAAPIADMSDVVEIANPVHSATADEGNKLRVSQLGATPTKKNNDEVEYSEIGRSATNAIDESETQVIPKIDQSFSVITNVDDLSPTFNEQYSANTANNESIVATRSEPERVSTDIVELASKGINDLPYYIAFPNDAPKITEICPDFSNKRPKYNLAVYAGPSLAMSSLQSKTLEHNSYLDARENSESAWISWQAGLRMDYDILDKLFLSAGFEYEQLNRQLVYRDPDEQRIQTVITIDTVITAIDTLVVIDTSSVAVEGVRAIKNVNTIKNFHIPLSLGYRYPINENVHLRLAGGVIFNLQSQQSGSILASDLMITQYGQESNSFEPYRMALGLGFQGDIGLVFRVSDQWSWFAETGLVYFPKSLTTENYSLDEQFSVSKLRLGISYKF